MIFLTQFNCQRLIRECLGLSQNSEHKKLKEIDLGGIEKINLGLFPDFQRDKLIICHFLLEGKELNDLAVKKIKEQEDKFIYEIKQPAYHINLKCEGLNSDFHNVLIPPSLPKDLRKEYQNYFIKNSEKYGRGTNKDARILARQVIEKFGHENLFTEKEIKENSDLHDFWVKCYFYEVEYENSGTAVVDFEFVNTLLNKLNDLALNEVAEDIAFAYIFLKDKAFWDRPIWEYRKVHLFTRKLNDDDREKYPEIARLQREITQHIISLSLPLMRKQGMNLTEYILEDAGFRRCRKCGGLMI